VYEMGCLMSPCPPMSPINDMPAGSLFVHHPQINGCNNMIPGVFYNPGYGGGACISVGSVDGGWKCCETTSGGFAAPNDPHCARDTVTLDAPGSTSPHSGGRNHSRHFDDPIPSSHRSINKVHHGGHSGQKGHGGGKHKGGQKQNHPAPVTSVKPEPGHNYYIQQAPLCTMRFPPGPHYTLIMCTATCQETFTYSGPSPGGDLALGTIGGSDLCHGKTAVPWSCIMSTPGC